MTRISLKESYDDRTVIVKLARIEDTANDCKDASEKAVTSAQTAEASAKESLGACNAAKASAEQSAKDAKTSADVVATYDARLNDKVSKTGDATPQVITGTGGLQVQGDVSVGGDLTVAESGSVHMDGSDMEIAGMAIEKSGTSTVLSNELGGLKIMGELTVPTTPTGSKTMLAVNGSRLQNDLDAYEPMVRTTGNQTITGVKTFVSPQVLTVQRTVAFSSTTGNKWIKVFHINTNSRRQIRGRLCDATSLIFWAIDTMSTSAVTVILNGWSVTGRKYSDSIAVTYDGDGYDVWIYVYSYATNRIWIDAVSSYGSDFSLQTQLTLDGTTAVDSLGEHTGVWRSVLWEGIQ